MASLPNITQPEIATLGAATFLLLVVPTLLAWSEDRKRRRAERQRAALDEVREEAPLLQSQLPNTLGMPALSEPELTTAAPQPPSDARAVSAWDEPAPPPPPPALLPSSDGAATAGAAQDMSAAGGEGSRVLRPLEGSWRHEFRLTDLRKVTLPDWPPGVIRDDPGRMALWREAERAVEQYGGTLAPATICSPYPARSSCLGAAASDGSNLQLRFLLFPVLWPVSQNQAVAQAVFQIDRVSGDVHGWVDALRTQELTAENRREIVEGGGDL